MPLLLAVAIPLPNGMTSVQFTNDGREKESCFYLGAPNKLAEGESQMWVANISKDNRRWSLE